MNYVYSLVGALLMAFAVDNVLEPMQFVTGGVSGLAIMIKYYTAGWFQEWGWFTSGYFKEGMPLWVTSVILNVPLYIAAYRIKGHSFLRNSLWGNFWLTFFLAVIPTWSVLPKEPFLNTLFGGILEGTGIGLVLRAKASTGGSDLLATLIHEKVPHYSIPQIMAVTDGIIVLLGFFAFGVEKGLYALVVIYLISQVSSQIIGGFQQSYIIYIISAQSEEIAKEIMTQLDRGVTKINVTGLYKGAKRAMLMCVSSKKQVVYIKEIVVKYDANAFVIITNARETLGEGFLNLGNNTR